MPKVMVVGGGASGRWPTACVWLNCGAWRAAQWEDLGRGSGRGSSIFSGNVEEGPWPQTRGIRKGFPGKGTALIPGRGVVRANRVEEKGWSGVEQFPGLGVSAQSTWEKTRVAAESPTIPTSAPQNKVPGSSMGTLRTCKGWKCQATPSPPESEIWGPNKLRVNKALEQTCPTCGLQPACGPGRLWCGSTWIRELS